ncbi:UPF0126 membrane protein [Dictyobacter sp. S3.2.2.5]|uniref:UPF0126 membrane protein n=1 Tax=Dictyobacter halimunensis TaxID=3026934 RepID=A0ABQ6G538_9CHLR|nr:UPF0126 membrane protein [Dictyobacter sp. S3.2.2.5]
MHPVIFNATLEEILNLVGTFAFAESGALLAVRKNYDIVGMAVLALITAIGGGVIRDLIIGAHPPVAFTNANYLWLALLATILTFFAHPLLNRLNVAILVFDAAGLAVFCISGAIKALAYGLGPLPAILLGTLTAIGGGVMRDILAQDPPAVLRSGSELYALPAALGATIIVIIAHFAVNDSLTVGLTAVFVFVLRLLALRYHWRGPRPRRASDTR